MQYSDCAMVWFEVRSVVLPDSAKLWTWDGVLQLAPETTVDELHEHPECIQILIAWAGARYTRVTVALPVLDLSSAQTPTLGTSSFARHGSHCGD